MLLSPEDFSITRDELTELVATYTPEEVEAWLTDAGIPNVSKLMTEVETLAAQVSPGSI